MSTVTIDHPLDPENAYLTHAGVAAPEMMNASTTTAKGKTILRGRLTSVSAALALGLVLALGLAAVPAHADNGAQGRCIEEAAQAGLIGPNVNPGNTNFVGGTDGDDNFTGRTTPGPDVICGFGGNDHLETLDASDVFLGGEGSDTVRFLYGGTFDGGPGDDRVGTQRGGTFNGGPGDDRVDSLQGGTFNGGPGDDRVLAQQGGTFNGGEGSDTVLFLESGTFNGGEGDDRVDSLQGGTFNGGEGNDHVGTQRGGTFNGGPGDDRVDFRRGGTFNQD